MVLALRGERDNSNVSAMQERNVGILIDGSRQKNQGIDHLLRLYA